ncbi:MAG TPA: hypothetical protein DEV72_13965, partial [Ktedonobacter sp.]|nr:hypothetical protein [Ktedonobacter sp.]
MLLGWMQEVTKHGVEQQCLLKAREYLLELRICLHNHIQRANRMGMATSILSLCLGALGIIGTT